MHSRFIVAISYPIAILTTLFIASNAFGLQINAGDILYGTTRLGSQGQIVRIDPATGVNEVVSSGGELFFPRGIAVGGPSPIWVTDRQNPNQAFMVVSPADGSQQIIKSVFSVINDLAFESTNSLLGVSTGNGILFRIDSATGETTQLSHSGLLGSPVSLALDVNDSILIVDSLNGLLRVDPISGAPSVIAALSGLSINSVAVSDAGEIYLSGGDSIFSFDRGTTLLTLVAQSGLLSDIADIAVGLDGSVVVADLSHVVSVDPSTGFQTLLSNVGAVSITTVPAPEPSTALLVGLGLVGLGAAGKRTLPR